MNHWGTGVWIWERAGYGIHDPPVDLTGGGARRQREVQRIDLTLSEQVDEPGQRGLRLAHAGLCLQDDQTAAVGGRRVQDGALGGPRIKRANAPETVHPGRGAVVRPQAQTGWVGIETIGAKGVPGHARTLGPVHSQPILGVWEVPGVASEPVRKHHQPSEPVLERLRGRQRFGACCECQREPAAGLLHQGGEPGEGVQRGVVVDQRLPQVTLGSQGQLRLDRSAVMADGG